MTLYLVILEHRYEDNEPATMLGKAEAPSPEGAVDEVARRYVSDHVNDIADKEKEGEGTELLNNFTETANKRYIALKAALGFEVDMSERDIRVYPVGVDSDGEPLSFSADRLLRR